MYGYWYAVEVCFGFPCYLISTEILTFSKYNIQLLQTWFYEHFPSLAPAGPGPLAVPVSARWRDCYVRGYTTSSIRAALGEVYILLLTIYLICSWKDADLLFISRSCSLVPTMGVTGHWGGPACHGRSESGVLGCLPPRLVLR